MQTITITASDTYPVTLQSVKDALRVSWADDDAMIQEYIAEATDFVERGLGRRLMTQTLRTAMYLPNLIITPLAGIIGGYDGYACEVPWSPVQSVTTVEIETQISSWVTLTLTDDYLVDCPDGLPTKVYLSTSALAQWAVALNYPGNKPRIRVTYIAGYSDDPKDVPASIRGNIRRCAMWRYENRSAPNIPDDMLDNSAKIWRLS